MRPFSVNISVLAGKNRKDSGDVPAAKEWGHNVLQVLPVTFLIDGDSFTPISRNTKSVEKIRTILNSLGMVGYLL